MRNPIWTGWRVIDKKRDMSAAGRYQKPNGRQADRRKVPRTPDETIRVRVIDEPLISEQDFQTVQKMMDLKQSKHWRSRGEIDHRFTYNGFLTCSECGEVVHTALARRDYYACKGRRVMHTCRTKYMAREKLEGLLDTMFAGRLTDPNFLENCLQEMKRRSDSNASAGSIQRLNSEIAGLRSKRSRVIDGFVDGIIDRDERDRRLAATDREINAAQEALLREAPGDPFDTAALLDKFALLADWEFWSRDQKRLVLATMVPDIRVADCKVESLGLNPAFFSNENTRPPAATSTTAPVSVTALR